MTGRPLDFARAAEPYLTRVRDLFASRSDA